MPESKKSPSNPSRARSGRTQELSQLLKISPPWPFPIVNGVRLPVPRSKKSQPDLSDVEEAPI